MLLPVVLMLAGAAIIGAMVLLDRYWPSRVAWSRPSTVVIDLAGILLLVLCVLLMVGVLPFTPVVVALLILLAKCEAKLTWDDLR